MNDTSKRLPSVAQIMPTVTHPLADEEAMMHVRAGQVEVLEVLFDRYQKPLFNFSAV